MAVFDIPLSFAQISVYVFMPRMDYLSVASAVLSYILYPVLLLLKAVLTILLILAAPIVQLGRYVFYACSWPIHFLARFEVNRKTPLTRFELLTSAKTLYVGLSEAIFPPFSRLLDSKRCVLRALCLANQRSAENNHIDFMVTNRYSSVSQR